MCALAACGDAPTAPPREGPLDLALPWEAAKPGALGVDEARLGRAVERADELGRVQNLLVIRQGRIVLERRFDGFGEDDLADVRSITKGVMATLIGIALERGDLPGLDATVADLLPESVTDVPEDQGAVTLRHLLTMTGGWAWDESTAFGYNDWVTAADPIGYLLGQPLVDEPGTRFRYNSAAVHLLGVILEEAVGPLPAYARTHLFDPAGIGPAAWEPLGAGRVNGGSGLDLAPRDLARIGQLLLQDGRSGSRQVIPTDWVGAMAAPASWTIDRGPTTVSYGYLWWTDEINDAWFGWGFGGQFLYVAPGRDLVVVATTRWLIEPDDRFQRNIALDVLRLVIEDIVRAAAPL